MSRFLHRMAFVVAPFLVACGGDDDEPPAESNEWAGHTYALNIGERSWREPRGAINDIKDYVPQFLLEVQGESPDEFEVLMASGKDDQQDPCNPTASLSGSGNAVGPGEFLLRIEHLREDIVVQATLHDWTLTEALPVGGTVSETGLFSATLDGRDVAPLFTQIDSDPTPDELCAALEQLSPPAPCEACPHDGEVYCLTLTAENVGLTEVTGTTITEIDEATDPSCE
jgi:hypothetical protein